MKTQLTEKINGKTPKELSSHGGGHRFNPCRSHHNKINNIPENIEENANFSGLPFESLPYRDSLKNTETYQKWCENSVKIKLRKRERAA